MKTLFVLLFFCISFSIVSAQNQNITNYSGFGNLKSRAVILSSNNTFLMPQINTQTYLDSNLLYGYTKCFSSLSLLNEQILPQGYLGITNNEVLLNPVTFSMLNLGVKNTLENFSVPEVITGGVFQVLNVLSLF